MAAPQKRLTVISPWATATTAATSSAADTNAEETTSPSMYFLPALIPLVASLLTSLQDFRALRAACRTYRALLPPSPANLASQTPLLIAPQKPSASESPLRRLLRFRLPCTLTLTRIYAFGCRVAICDCTYGFRCRRELRIIHLLTSEQARLPDPPKDFEGVIFSGDLILAFARWHHVLYYCRIGDAYWREASCDDGYLFYGLICVKGTIYALVCPDYRLAVVELHNKSVKLTFLEDESSAQIVQNNSGFRFAECRDELLLVVTVQHSPRVFHVFRWQSEERKWARTTSLGGCSLFFNRFQFAGCLGPDHPAVQRDTMYFTGCAGQWGEYSLVDGSWHDYVANYPGRAAGDFVPLAWVLPSMG